MDFGDGWYENVETRPGDSDVDGGGARDWVAPLGGFAGGGVDIAEATLTLVWVVCLGGVTTMFMRGVGGFRRRRLVLFYFSIGFVCCRSLLIIVC